MSDNASLTASRDDRVAEVLDAYLEAMKAGVPPDMDELLARYPDLAEDLKECLASLAFIRQAEISENRSPRDGKGVPSADNSAGVLGDFHILREVGKGGMGVVYEAEQISLGRRVALKVLPFAATMDPRHLQRFHNEARAAASLDHPHIVRVHAVGCERGVHYFAMKFIEGQSLAELIAARRQASANGGSPSPAGISNQRADAATQPIAAVTTRSSAPDAAHYRRIAEWGIQAAEALEHAHGLGIVHRDIKPGNLMIDEAGKLWITDFGLAHTVTNASLTMSGDLLGTLRYMSPEQALARHGLVDHRTDIYSLGATLYELLTGCPAVPGEDRQLILRRIAEEEPRPPRAIDRGVPSELEIIVLKAMAREPVDRYATAQELADDLHRFMLDQPIRARAVGRLERLRRWCRRNRILTVLSALSAGLALAFIAGLMASLWVIVGQRDEVSEQNKQIQEQDRRLRYHLYAGDMKLAYQAWKQGGMAQLDELLERHRPKGGEDDLRTFVWYYLRRLAGGLRPVRTLEGHRNAVFFLAFSPDGKTLATAGEDGTVRLWDAQSGQEQLVLRASYQDIDCVAFSPDGRTLATTGDDGITRLWETATGRPLAQLHEHRGEAVAVLFSPDDKTLATAGEDGIVRLWDVASWKLMASLQGHKARIEALSFSPDGKNLISSGRGESATHHWGTAISWDLTTRQGRTCLAQYGWVKAAAYSHGGLLAAFGDDGGQLHLWDSASGRVQGRWLGHASSIESVAFSPNDKLLASAGHEGVRVWDVASHSLRHMILSPGERVWCVRFSPDGRTLAVSVGNGTARLYDLAAAQPCEPYPSVPYRFGIVLSPDGQTAAAQVDDCSIRTWNVTTGILGPSLIGQQKTHGGICFRADGKTLLTAGRDQTARIWDIATGKPLGPPLRHLPWIDSGDLSPDGSVAITIRYGGARCWETASGEERNLFTFKPYVRAVSFSPDGKWVAAAVEDRHVQLWDRQTRRLEYSFRVPTASACVHTLRFSSDSALLAAGYDYGIIQLWDTRTGQELRTLTGSRERIQFLVISPDGKTLASGSPISPEIRLWDVRTGQEVASLEGHIVGHVNSLAFTPDGARLISAAEDGDGHAEIGRWSAPLIEEDSSRK